MMEMSPTEKQDLETAYHEIGHWLAADELNVPTGRLSIDPQDDGTAGRISVEGDDRFFSPPGVDSNSDASNNAFRQWAFTQAVIDYAGHAALVVILGIGDMGEDCAANSGALEDFQKARQRLGGNEAWISDAKHQATEIISNRADDAGLIADKLIRIRQLDSQQIDLLLGGTWSVFLNEDGTPKG